MIKVAVFSYFWNLKTAAEIMTDVFQKGPNNFQEQIQFVDKDYTHAIIINNYMPNIIDIPKENIIGLAWEPLDYLGITPIWLKYVENNIRTYFIGELRQDFPSNIVLGYPFMCHERRRDNYFNNIIPDKTKQCCIIFSKKRSLRGHKYRFDIVDYILRSNLPIDIYGRGCSLLKQNDGRIKGEFTSMDDLKHYKYIISIENTKYDSYISEKFINCIYNNTIPIYYGANNINKYFGDNCCFKLSGNISTDMILIKQILTNDITIDLTNARKELFTGSAYLMQFLLCQFKNE